MTKSSRRTGGRDSGVVDVVIIGAGHSGLAMSHCLTSKGIEHVILERGEVANSWRRERWDSLRLLTPNWLCRLPGAAYEGPDPDGFMTMPEVIRFIADYASRINAPVWTGVNVTSVEPCDDGYRVCTEQGVWHCRAVVIATGACNRPSVPPLHAAVPGALAQLTPHAYRGPAQLEPGGVLVVGASASGMQLADEIQRAGHAVTLAVGEHVRLPRRYRGRDIQWWMKTTGVSDQRYDEVDDLTRARRVPSPQLAGSKDELFMDLNTLAARGVRIVGKLAGIRDGKALFSGSLRNTCAMADLKMNRLLDTIDAWADANGVGQPRERFEPTRVPPTPCLGIDLGSGEFRTVLWATGYRPDYSWLDVPVLDRRGEVRHDGGVTVAPGLYVTGLPFLRRRKSSFIHGAEDDARELSEHLASWLDRRAREPARAIA